MTEICKKTTLIITAFLLCFFINYKTVNASEISTNVNNLFFSAVGQDANCSALGDPTIVDDPAYWLQYILNIMKYMAIVALLIFTTKDFFQAMVANDKDAIKKASQKTMKRFIYCILIFFLPNLVELVMEWIGAYGTCGIK